MILDRIPDGVLDDKTQALKLGSVIEAPGPGEDAMTVMNRECELSVLTGDTLSNMGQVISNLYLPLLDFQLSDGDGDGQVDVAAIAAGGGDVETGVHEGAVTIGSNTTIATEFKANMQRFAGHIAHAIRQVKGDVQLQVPNIHIDNPEDVTEYYEVVQQLENAMEDWSKLVATVVEQENSKKPRGKGPVAEIDFWRQRNAALSALYEQINMPNVQAMLKVLSLVEAPMLATFNYNYSELQKLYVEAKDNVKFLQTLDRHFKNIDTGSFSTILDTLPSMMNAIRMVWIISRHYNTDERMVPLMERIAAKIAEKVEVEINIRSILRKSPEVAKKLIKEAQTVLEAWQSNYMQVRQRIEESGTHIRWEFDRKRLFEQTNYMARTCADLYEVATVLDQFHKFLGPELKAVTGESEGIDEVMTRVEQLVEPLETVPFNIFDRRYKDSWSGVMTRFHQHVAEIEEMTKSFIELSFQKLRSAEGAFELVENFRNIQSRESINTQINERYKDILQQYTKELEGIHHIFETHRANAPIYKNYPPVAGAIAWARDLYTRAKKPILRFKGHEGLLQSEFGEEVKQRYLAFARAVDAYVSHLFKDWEARVQGVATEKLKQPILAAAGKTEEGGKGTEDADAAAEGGPRRRDGQGPGQPGRRSTTSSDAAAAVQGQLRARALDDHPREQVPRPHGLCDPRGRAQRDAAGGQVPHVPAEPQPLAQEVREPARLAHGRREPAAAQADREPAARAAHGLHAAQLELAAHPELHRDVRPGAQRVRGRRLADPEELDDDHRGRPPSSMVLVQAIDLRKAGGRTGAPVPAQT